jgi:HEAT repeat protein
MKPPVLFSSPSETGRRAEVESELAGLEYSQTSPTNVITTLLKDRDSEVRALTAYAVTELEQFEPDVFEELALLLKDKEQEVRSIATGAIGVIGQKASQFTDERLFGELTSYDSTVRDRAGILLAHRPKKDIPEIRKQLYKLNSDARPWVRQAATRAIFQIERATTIIRDDSVFDISD